MRTGFYDPNENMNYEKDSEKDNKEIGNENKDNILEINTGKIEENNNKGNDNKEDKKINEEKCEEIEIKDKKEKIKEKDNKENISEVEEKLLSN